MLTALRATRSIVESINSPWQVADAFAVEAFPDVASAVVAFVAVVVSDGAVVASGVVAFVAVGAFVAVVIVAVESVVEFVVG